VYATWLTADGEFWEFEAFVSWEDGSLIELARVENVTASTSISAHERGTGKSFGLLAIEVLRENDG